MEEVIRVTCVVRGGAWIDYLGNVRSLCKLFSTPKRYYTYVGFCLVKVNK